LHLLRPSCCTRGHGCASCPMTHHFSLLLDRVVLALGELSGAGCPLRRLVKPPR
jgi:hypothetical protein